MVAVVEVQTTGTGDAIARLEGLAQRARDLTPALKDVAREVEKRTDDAFRRSVSPDGEAWPALAYSTRVSRLRKRKGVWQRITKAKNGKRVRVLDADQASAIISRIEAVKLTSLVDTGRMRNSSHAEVSGPTSVRWSAVWYMGPHMTGGKQGRPPKRNPAVFEKTGGGWRLIAAVRRYMADRVRKHVGGR